MDLKCVTISGANEHTDIKEPMTANVMSGFSYSMTMSKH